MPFVPWMGKIRPISHTFLSSGTGNRYEIGSFISSTSRFVVNLIFITLGGFRGYILLAYFRKCHNRDPRGIQFVGGGQIRALLEKL